jgi:hypothetical protein
VLGGEASFGAFAAGDVGNENVVSLVFDRTITAGDQRVLHPSDGAVLVADAVLDGRNVLSPQEFLGPGCDRCLVRLVNSLKPQVRVAFVILRSVAGDGLTAGAGNDALGSAFPADNAKQVVRGRAEQLFVAFVFPPEPCQFLSLAWQSGRASLHGCLEALN